MPETRSSLGLFAVLLALATVIFGTTMPTPLYAGYKETYDLPDWSVTGIYAIFAGGIVLALILLNGLSDWVGRRGALWTGLAVFVVSDLVFLTWTSEIGLYAARVVTGLSSGIYVGTATVAAIEVAPEHRKTRASTYATAANVLGLGLGPAVAGLIVEYAPSPERTVFLVHLALVALSALALTTMPEPHRRGGATGFAPPTLPRRGVAAFLGAAGLALAGLAAFGLLAGLTQAFLDTIAGVRSPMLTGFAVGLAFIVSGVTQLGLARVPARAGLRHGSLLLVASLALICLAIPAGAVWLYVAGAVVCGIGQGLTMARSVGIAAQVADEADRMGNMNMFFTIAYFGAGVPIVGLGFAITYLDFLGSAIAFAVVVAAITAAGLAAALTAAPRRTA